MSNENYPPVSLDYKKDLTIDQHNLELEWLAIAGQIMAYSEAHVQAQFDRDRAKQRRDVVEAELDLKARTEPCPEDLPKSAKTGQPTETAVLNWIHKQPEYQVAQKERQEREYVVNMLQAAVFAFQAKKTALENLVRLFGMKYYAEPYEPPGSGVREAGKDRAKHEALGTLKETTRLAASSLLPEVKLTTPCPPCKPPAPPDRDKDGHRYAIGPIAEHGRHVFTKGPFPKLQQTMQWPGKEGEAIYRLTREKPDEIIYVWVNGSEWVIPEDFKAKEIMKPKPTQPPSPPPRPLPRRPGK